MTVEKLLHARADQLRNQRTARKLRHLANFWRKCGGAEAVEQITPDALDAFRKTALADGKSPNTIETAIGDLVSACNKMGRPIASKGNRLRRRPPAARQPTIEEFGRAYACCDAARWPGVNQSGGEWLGSPGDFWRTFFALGYLTAARLTDLLTLTWDAVHPDRIAWTAGKTSKQHAIPTNHVFRRILDKARQESGSGRILCVALMARKAMRESLRTICKAAGVPTITAHQIRRLSITQWGCTGGDAGMIVHGQSLGMRMNYYAQFSILSNYLPRLRIPDQMLTPAERDAKTLPLAELSEVCSRLTPERIRDLARMGAALG